MLKTHQTGTRVTAAPETRVRKFETGKTGPEASMPSKWHVLYKSYTNLIQMLCSNSFFVEQSTLLVGLGISDLVDDQAHTALGDDVGCAIPDLDGHHGSGGCNA